MSAPKHLHDGTAKVTARELAWWLLRKVSEACLLPEEDGEKGMPKEVHSLVRPELGQKLSLHSQIWDDRIFDAVSIH